MGWSDLPVGERMIRKFQMEIDDKPAAEKKPPEVLVPGHPTDPTKLKGQPASIVKLLSGREVEARHSRCRVEGEVYKSGAKVGQKRADKEYDCYAIATVDRQYPVVHAVWIDGKLALAEVLAERGGQRVEFGLVTTLQKFLKGELGE